MDHWVGAVVKYGNFFDVGNNELLEDTPIAHKVDRQFFEVVQRGFWIVLVHPRSRPCDMQLLEGS